MRSNRIDINCDMGEGVGNEAQLMPLISSCNIACGGHAGDWNTMMTCVRLAQEHHVKIGAHPSYPDREHFGRRSLGLSPNQLIVSLREQMQQMETVLQACGASLHHIKPHGALYNDLARDPALGAVFLEALDAYKERAVLYVLAGSPFGAQAREAGFSIRAEAFADRAYNTDGSLVSRTLPGAVLHTPEAVLKQVLDMVQRSRVRAVQGGYIPMEADTYCVHGDTPEAYEILMYLSHRLPEHSIHIAK